MQKYGWQGIALFAMRVGMGLFFLNEAFTQLRKGWLGGDGLTNFLQARIDNGSVPGFYEPLLTDLNAFMDSVNEQVTGSVTMRLYKGSARPVARQSPNSLYDPALAGFGESGGLFSQQASPGFIELWSLQSRMAYRIRNRGKGEE